MPIHARLLAAVVAVLLVAGLGAAIVRDDDSVQTVGSTTTTGAVSTVPGETTTTGVPSSDLDRAIADIEAFVAKARGLAFKQRVKVTLLDDKAFRARLQEDDEVDKEQLAKTTKVLRALDLLDEDVDLEEATRSLLGEAVLGFYDYEKDEMVIRGAELTPGVRRTLAHELTHALQDQWFELDRPELDERDDEAESSWTALVEGDARRIERQYAATMSKSDQRKADEQTSSADIDPDVPRVLLESLSFPYIVGLPFANRVVADGGQARLDEAFRAPPTTSEHVMHPDTYLRGEQPRPVAEPAADGAVFDRGVVGEFGLVLVMEDDLSERDLLRAAAGWGGDRYVAWEQDGRICLRAAFVMDTAKDLDELRKALVTWTREHDGATVTGPAEGPLTLTSCR